MRRSALLLCLAACVACSGIRVSTDYDPEADFGSLSSYAWLEERSGVRGDREGITSLLDRRVRAAVADELQSKGLASAARGDADLLVMYHLSAERKLDVDVINSNYGAGPGRWNRVGSTQTVVREYQEGTLVIDLVDAATRELVWRGTGQTRLREYSDPERREKRLRDAVKQILEGSPQEETADIGRQVLQARLALGAPDRSLREDDT